MGDKQMRSEIIPVVERKPRKCPKLEIQVQVLAGIWKQLLAASR